MTRAGEGEITSGTYSPTLARRSRWRGCRPASSPGETAQVEIRGKALAARVVETAVRAPRQEPARTESTEKLL